MRRTLSLNLPLASVPTPTFPKQLHANGEISPETKKQGEFANVTSNDLTAPAIFDYGKCEPAVGAELRAVAADIRARDRDAKRAMVEIGASLSRVKDKVGHGDWGIWLAAEFEMSISTAERYMRVADLFGDKFGIVTSLHAKTLYLMSAKSTPAEVVDEIVADLEAGKPLSNEAIGEQIAQAKWDINRAAEEAKLTPRQRRTRAQRLAEQDRWRLERERERAAGMVAAAAAAKILARRLGDDLGGFLALVEKAYHSEMIKLLRDPEWLAAFPVKKARRVAVSAHDETVSKIVAADLESDDEPMLPFMSGPGQPLVRVTVANGACGRRTRSTRHKRERDDGLAGIPQIPSGQPLLQKSQIRFNLRKRKHR